MLWSCNRTASFGGRPEKDGNSRLPPIRGTHPIGQSECKWGNACNYIQNGETTIMNRLIHAARPVRFAFSIAMVLLVALLLAQSAAAEVKGSAKQRADGQSDFCTADGGIAEITFEYSPVFKGVIIKATMKCKGGKSDGWECTNTPTDTTCTNPLVRTPETTAQSVTAQPGTIVGAVDTGSVATPTPIVLDQATAGPTAPERPTRDPESGPTIQDDERAP